MECNKTGFPEARSSLRRAVVWLNRLNVQSQTLRKAELSLSLYLVTAIRRRNAEAKRAFELDPLSPMINTWLGFRYYDARQYGEAIAQGRKILEFDPSFAPAHLLLGQA